jgi:glycosyltransferase involved in cell wall biosynthesis
MALGLPVITFDSAVSRQYLGESGIYARYADREDLAQRIIDTLNDEGLRSAAATTNRLLALQHHSIAHIGPALEDVYATVSAPVAITH